MGEVGGKNKDLRTPCYLQVTQISTSDRTHTHTRGAHDWPAMPTADGVSPSRRSGAPLSSRPYTPLNYPHYPHLPHKTDFLELSLNQSSVCLETVGSGGVRG